MTHKNYKVYSDIHLRHRKILDFCDRPWNDVDEMSESLMDIMVSQSRDNDVLIFCGDLLFQFGTYFDWMVKRMKDVRGEKMWILGNHDPVMDKNGLTFREKVMPLVEQFDYVGSAFQRIFSGKNVFFSHYPLEIPRADSGRLVSIHGHTHGTVENYGGRIDVGVDNLYGLRNHSDAKDILSGYDFSPISLHDAFELSQRNLPAAYSSREGIISF